MPWMLKQHSQAVMQCGTIEEIKRSVINRKRSQVQSADRSIQILWGLLRCLQVCAQRYKEARPVQVISCFELGIKSLGGMRFKSRDECCVFVFLERTMKTMLAAGSFCLFILICLSSCQPENAESLSPTITLQGNEELQIFLYEDYEEPGFSAIDPEDGDITMFVSVDSTVDNTMTGTYTITYHVVDSDGNEDTAVRTVNVVNEAHFLAGGYLASNECDMDPDIDNPYEVEIILSTTQNNWFYIVGLWVSYEDEFQQVWGILDDDQVYFPGQIVAQSTLEGIGTYSNGSFEFTLTYDGHPCEQLVEPF